MSFAYICQDFMSHVCPPRIIIIIDDRALHTVNCKGKCTQAHV